MSAAGDLRADIARVLKTLALEARLKATNTVSEQWDVANAYAEGVEAERQAVLPFILDPRKRGRS